MQVITLHKLATPGSYTARQTFWVALLVMTLLTGLNCLMPRDVRLHLVYVIPMGCIALHARRRRIACAGLMYAIACQVAISLYLGLGLLALCADTLVFAGMGLLVVSLGWAARKSHLQVRDLASFDTLTGLLNRRSFEARLQAEINRQKRYGGCFSLALLDLDKFKWLNDSRGHNAGDLALRRIAALMTGSSRNTDAVFRLGGDEFAILMPNTGKQHAITHCESICQAICASMVTAGFDVTASIGVASFDQAPESLDHVVLQADTAMYAAKALQASTGAVVGV